MRHHSNIPARRLAWLLALAAMLVAAALPAAAQAHHGSKPEKELTVMSRNLYLGTGLNGLIGVTAGGIPGAAYAAWNNVVATNFPARSAALAKEIDRADADVVGLQEVTWWRQDNPNGLPADGIPYLAPPGTPANASTTVYDFLALLQSALNARGLHYTAVSTSTNADVELPRFDPTVPTPPFPQPVRDTRLTDRDVILVRDDLVSDTSNARDGHYVTQLAVPVGGGSAEFTRGWTSIDIKTKKGKVRVINSHLEVEGPSAPIQVAQGNELLALVNASPYPVVAVGDFNSDALGGPGGTATYGNLIAGGLKDAAGSSTVPTCCQNELLTNATSEAASRIDLVLTKGRFKTDDYGVFGGSPFRAFPAPLWASDHAGVAAEVTLK